MQKKLVYLIATSAFLASGMTHGYSANGKQRVAGRTSQPIGHYEYCLANVADCNLRTLNTWPTQLTSTRWAQMVETNAHVNATITPTTDLEHYGVEEFWILPETSGDCEDYVLLKRRKLMELGWPASSLLATVVLQPNGDGHAVLTVRTDRGDFVLDNLQEEIVTWDQTDYKFLKRQAASNSGHWEDIIDTRATVASISRR